MNIQKLQVFKFDENEVRVHGTEEKPLFIVKDVCDALGIQNVTTATQNLEEDELTYVVHKSGGQNREMLAVDESGLYALIFQSRKAEAKAFRRWVTREVLPSIRKTGRYEVKRPRARSLPGPSSRLLAGMIETHAGQISPFKGTVKELWIEMSRAGHNSPLWPSTPSQFGAQLNPILPLLAQKGIVITRLPRRGAGQMLVLTTGAPIVGAQPPELPLVERESLETRVGRLEELVAKILRE